MKRLALAFVAYTVGISAVQAHNGFISTGPYLGIAAGYTGVSGKYSVPGSGAGNPPIYGTLDVGGTAPSIGIYGGYGVVNNCLYYGAEIAYTFENLKMSDSLNTSIYPSSGLSQLKRNGYFNAALRGGYLIVPASMVYIRLGLSWGRWTYNDSNFYVGPFQTTAPGSGSKSRITVVPGIGSETALTKNFYLRLEYSYEFGPTLTATNSSVPASITKVSSVQSHMGKVGLTFKF